MEDVKNEVIALQALVAELTKRIEKLEAAPAKTAAPRAGAKKLDETASFKWVKEPKGTRQAIHIFTALKDKTFTFAEATSTVEALVKAGKFTTKASAADVARENMTWCIGKGFAEVVPATAPQAAPEAPKPVAPAAPAKPVTPAPKPAAAPKATPPKADKKAPNATTPAKA